MDVVDVIVPSLGKQHFIGCMESLSNIPFGIRLHVVTKGDSWPEAINIGLGNSSGDVILMDDDVRILPNTFKDIDKYYNCADIFGFKLLFENGDIQHAGGFYRDGSVGHIGWGMKDSGALSVPYYCCHLTASLLYIKREVINSLIGMKEDYPGYQFEDVDFSFRALKNGFKMLYIPGDALHMESKSKKNIDDFSNGFQKNYDELRRRFLTDKSFTDILETFPRFYEIQ